MNDQELKLLRQAQAGDSQSLGQLLERYGPFLLSEALKLRNGHMEDARDLVQTSYEKALEHFSKFQLQPDSSFLSWLLRILQNTAKDLGKKKEPVFLPELREAEESTKLNDAELLEEVRALPTRGKDFSTFREVVEQVLAGNAGSLEDLARLALAKEGNHLPTQDQIKAKKHHISVRLSRVRNTPEGERFLARVTDRRGALWAVGGITYSLAFGELAGAFEVMPRSTADLAVQQASAAESEKIARLANARSTDELLHVLIGLDWSFSITSHARQMLALAKDPSRILRLGLPLIHGQGNTPAHVLGILGIMMNTCARWTPSRSEFNFLTRLCEYVLKKDDIGCIPWIEPLALGVAMRGRPSAYRDYLLRIIEDECWRTRDAATNLAYYGSVAASLSAVMRHIGERRGPALTKLSDVASLMELASLRTSEIGGFSARRTLASMLSTTGMLLEKAGEPRLSQKVVKLHTRLKYIQ